MGQMRHLALAALVFAGCGTGPGRTDGSVDACLTDGRLEVGAGGARLVPLPREGGELPIVHGPQGGIHVVVGFWVRDLPLEMDAAYRLEDPTDASEVGTGTMLHLTPSLLRPDGARYERHPDLIVLNNESADVSPFAGRVLDLQAEVWTTAGHACDTRTVTLVDSP